MQDRAEKTKNQILEAAYKEFMEYGFTGASLRNIASEAGVTTGAIYGFFPDKNALFAELVKPIYEGLEKKYSEYEKEYFEIINEDIINSMHRLSEQMIIDFIDFIYNNIKSARLLFKCSEGSIYSGYIHSIIDKETEANMRFFEEIKNFYHSKYEVDEKLVHILASINFNAISELIVHGIARERGKKIIMQTQEVFIVAWERLIEKIKKEG